MSDDQFKRPNWNENEFMTFLLLYCAHIDTNFDDNEKSMIQNLLDKDHYVAIRDIFSESNDAQCIEIIRSFKGLYFPTSDRKEILMDKVGKLFEVDGDYSNIEQGVFMSMNRLL